MIAYDDFLREGKKEFFNHKILAHTKNWNSQETLKVHSSLTLKYFNKLLLTFGLDNVAEKLISDVFPDEKKEYIREFIECIVYFHDIGKINPNYQKKLNNIISIDTTLKNSHHSALGYIIFISMLYNRFKGKISNQNNLISLFVLASAIKNHHTNLKDMAHILNDEDLLVSAHGLYTQFFDPSKSSNGKIGDDYIYSKLKTILTKKSSIEISEEIDKNESFFYLYKLIYSLLIISDYYATLEYKKGVDYSSSDFNLLASIKEKIIDNFYNNPDYPYNQGLNSQQERKKIQKESYSGINQINELRNKILYDANDYFDNVNLDEKKRVFYLRLPTGAGKTNISISLAINIIKRLKNLNRIYYVFPFINIIEQNYKTIKETLKLDDKVISEIYSNSEWLEKGESEEEEWKYYLNNEFLNYPINIMSNVNFFNTFIKAGKAQNYKFHNFANSVVIIDEIQSLNDHDWTMFINFIAFSSQKLNIYYLIMSATLPRLNNLFNENERFIDDVFVNIFPKEVEEKIYNHPLLKERVTLRLRHDIQKKEEIEILLEENTRNIISPKAMVVVNTIKDSLEIYDLFENIDWIKNRFNKIVLLNSTILPFKRRKIIDEIKLIKKSILLISTQSVEAGVDIDCDYGIRDFAIFDSIEQVAGRVNRNCKKNNSVLDIILLKEKDQERWLTVYRNSERGKVLKENYLGNEKLKEFIEKRDILDFYDKVISIKKDKNINRIQQNDRDSINYTRNLNFEKLNKKNVISQCSISFFVPLNLTKETLSDYTDIFSQREKDFLRSLDINWEEGFKTEVLWEYYNSIIRGEKSIRSKKIDLKKFNSLITKFIFSVSCNDKQIINTTFNNGINLLDKNQFPYTLEKGFDATELRKRISNETEFW